MSKPANNLLKSATGKKKLTFAMILKAELDDSDYNQTSLAKKIGVSRVQVRSYLQGSIPSPEVFRKICKTFGHSQDVLRKYIIQDLIDRTNNRLKDYDSRAEVKLKAS